MKSSLIVFVFLSASLVYGVNIAEIGKKVRRIIATAPFLLPSLSAPGQKSALTRSSSSALVASKPTFTALEKFPTRPNLPFGMRPYTPREERPVLPSVPRSVSPPFIREAVQRVGPSVVRIDCDREVSSVMALFSNAHMEGDTIRVMGTGIVASADGYIMTNAHVVEGAKRVTVTLSSGRSFKAKVIESDELSDLAVLRADLSREPSSFSLVPAVLGDSRALHAGDWVVAVGCPHGLDFTVTLGVISCPSRSTSSIGAVNLRGVYIQTDAALNSGNSGGPLVNEQGEVVGLNTMVRSNSENIGFSLPSHTLQRLYPILRSGRKPSHAYVGVELTSLTPDEARIRNENPNAPRLPEIQGALVGRVVTPSPAEKAGLRRGDVIVQVGGVRVMGGEDAEVLLDQAHPHRPLMLTIVRGGGDDEEAAVDKERNLVVSPLDLQDLLRERREKQKGVIVVKPSDE
eukprot:gene32969-39872_t